MKTTALFCAAALVAGTAVHAMGPDPGGHTGATVTPETTRTDRPQVDAARKSNSGSTTETNGAPAKKATQARRK